MNRDSQRSALYAWEHQILVAFPALSRKLTLDECRAYLLQVWQDYRPDTLPPEITDGRGRRNACGSRRRIALPVWARKPGVLLHETAHALLDGCSPEPWHGPTFARLFFEMIVHYERVPAAEIRRLAVHQKPRRVWFAEAADCPKRVRISAERRRWEERLRELQEAVAAHKRAEPTP